MRILIHMGNYKTGSTALQHFFHINRDIFRRYGIYYGQYDEYPLCSHASFTYRILIETLESLGMQQACAHHPLTAHLQTPAEKIWEKMLQEAEQNGCKWILLSHEAIFCEAYRTFCGLSYVPEPEEQGMVRKVSEG
jgi:hypothetical protein